MEIIYTKKTKKLAESISEKMSVSAFPINVRQFYNGEISVSLRKPFHNAVVIASTETNDDWIELFLLLDALRSSANVILCLSYMGYSRQDQQLANESFAAGLFARLLENMNISRCIVVDNHSEPLFRIPTQHISTQIIFEKDISRKYVADQIVVVAPDLGGVHRAYNIAKSLKCEFAICNKAKSVFGDLKRVDHIGSVNGKICILIDDMIDSGATLCYASESLTKAGSRGVAAYCTHGVLSNGSIEKIKKSQISEVVLTDSIQKTDELSEKFRRLSIDSLIIDAIKSSGIRSC